MKKLVFDQEKCTGCSSCMLACSFEKEKIYNVKKASLQMKREEIKLPILDYCRHCSNPKCLDACQTGAMKLKDNIVIVDHDKCTACGDCIEACPFNAVFIFKNRLYKCDTCDGQFKCTTVCATKALDVK